MAIFKCKMCGGSLDIQENTGIAVCEYCGSEQTIPRKDNDAITNLFNRANNLRLKCEFDKAQEIYEKILNTDNTDAEAHWGVVLCKYGIEYVEDPKTFKRVPTCHRVQYESVLADADYIAAIENADTAQQSVYTAQALDISRLQKDILAIVKKEKPFDVFICYKETDENGKRTVDSALANDIYYQLTNEGLKVFYSAITLEDKLGQEYEPYIFAALHSAKVLLVIGTKPEYFEAVWVRNEWSRFLSFMKTDRSKLLIPCYRDMDAYDLPEEFSHLQAQDMSKIGFVNDVVRGIRKVLSGGETEKTVTAQPAVTPVVGANVSALLKRAFMFLEDGKWQEADEYCEKVLDNDPECAEAYLGKLMAELHVHKRDQLKDAEKTFDHSDNCQKASRFDATISKELADINTYILSALFKQVFMFLEAGKWVEADECCEKVLDQYPECAEAYLGKLMAELHVHKREKIKDTTDPFDQSENCRKASRFDATIAKELADANTYIRERNETARKENIYQEAVTECQKETQDGYSNAADLFALIPGYKDAEKRVQECLDRVEEMKKDAIYRQADYESRTKNDKAEADYLRAADLFASIPGYKDADERTTECRAKAEEVRKDNIYKAADSYKVGTRIADLETALKKYESIADYKDARTKADECRQKIEELKIKQEKEEAERKQREAEAAEAKRIKAEKHKKLLKKIAIISSVVVALLIVSYIVLNTVMIPGSQYNKAVALADAGEYEQAIASLEALGKYKDANQKISEYEKQIKENQYQKAVALADAGEYKKAIAMLKDLDDYKDSKDRITEIRAELAEEESQKASEHLINKRYNSAVALAARGEYQQAVEIFKTLGDYKDSVEKLEEYSSRISE